MTEEQRQQPRKAALAALNGTRVRARGGGTMEWQPQTSNSFRRIGTPCGDGNVLCGTKHPLEGHPDLLAAPAVLDYIVAAQPSAVLALLDDVDQLERPRVDATTLMADEQALVIELCYDLINRAMVQESANHGECGDEWSVAERRKEAALRKLLRGCR